MKILYVLLSILYSTVNCINNEEKCSRPGEIYLECQNPCPTPANDHIKCPNLCVSGCYCAKGLIRDKLGNCYPDTNVAPPGTHCVIAGEEFVHCKYACVITCQNYHNYSDSDCNSCYTGCICAEGLVRNNIGICINKNQCQNPPEPGCGSYFEEWVNCKCEATCENINPICNKIECHPGCACKYGYLRKNGDCIPYSVCQNQTKSVSKRQVKLSCILENEVWSDCGPKCQPSCEIPYPENCSTECEKGCFCQPNFIRNSEGKCVKSSDCI